MTSIPFNPSPGPVPAVSVLMAVHNGLPYLESALRSIMTQTLADIEIIVVDDASTDDTPAVLARLAAGDPRIRIVTLDTNHRLAGALNRGLDLARAPLVARMDADDIAHPNRLAVQKAYMDANPEVVLCGASNRRIDAEGRVLSTEMRDLNAVLLRWRARFGMPLVHPTFMFRRFDAAGQPWRYDPAFPVAQDYDFTVRALAQGDVVSLPDVLFDWRIHKATTSATKAAEQTALAEDCVRRVQLLEMTEAQRRALAPFMEIVFRRSPVTVGAVVRSLRLFRHLLADDARRWPEHAGELRRQAVALLVYHLGFRGIGYRRVLVLMAVFAPGLFRAGLDERRARRRHRLRGSMA